jgi:hypothetical protein
MALANQLDNLYTYQLKELEQTIIHVGIAIYGKGKPFEMLRRIKNAQAKGSVLFRLYEKLYKAEKGDLIKSVEILMNDIEGRNVHQQQSH